MDCRGERAFTPVFDVLLPGKDADSGSSKRRARSVPLTNR
jgi:hypothetical protein